MFAAIEAARPEGLHYSSWCSSDGVTFVALLALDEGVENPLPAIAEFQDFQAASARGWRRPRCPTR